MLAPAQPVVYVPYCTYDITSLLHLDIYLTTTDCLHARLEVIAGSTGIFVCQVLLSLTATNIISARDNHEYHHYPRTGRELSQNRL